MATNAEVRRGRIFAAIADGLFEMPIDDMHPTQADETDRITDLVMAAILAADNQTDDGAAVSGPTLRPAVSPPAPSSPISRRFQLLRHVDVSGVSGTGVVAEGAEWSDGSASVRWHGDHRSTAAWPSVEDVVAVHGHEGATELRWLDDLPIDLWPAEGAPE